MSWTIPTRPVIEISKKIAKKKKKNFKNPLWLLLKPKHFGKCREREKTKIIVSINSYPTHNREFQKKSKKSQKIKKHCYGLFSSQNRLGNIDKERKQKLSFRSVPAWPGLENFKKIAKKFKKLKKSHYSFFSSQNRLERPGKREKLSFRSILIQLVIENSKKIAKKFKKL